MKAEETERGNRRATGCKKKKIKDSRWKIGEKGVGWMGNGSGFDALIYLSLQNRIRWVLTFREVEGKAESSTVLHFFLWLPSPAGLSRKTSCHLLLQFSLSSLILDVSSPDDFWRREGGVREHERGRNRGRERDRQRNRRGEVERRGEVGMW